MSLPRHSTFPLRTAAANRLGSRGGGGRAARLLILLGVLGPQLARAAAGSLAAPEGSFVEHWFVPTLIVGVLAVVGVSAAGAITRRTLLREIARLEQESRATRERAERLEGSEQRARSELAATTRARNAFLATLGQEVRTPMNSILGLNGLLLDTSLTSHQRQLADGVQTSAEALLSIVHDLLDLSRIEKGQSSVEETDLHFRQVLECAVDMYADRAHRKGLELVSHALREVPTHLRGDPARIRQVLLSMIGNAVRMASGGEVLVEAACGASSPDAVEVTVAVTHQGQGLSASALESLARDAGQLHAVPVEVSEGPGLGISVSARLLHLMGGQLAPAPAAPDRAGLVARFRL
ncbi:MAG: hypothetical protein IT580_11255, partial [Verrucomicrobiales bacterium]|nr:hypothetical protein [Verrucomicrobiales bacterium]